MQILCQSKISEAKHLYHCALDAKLKSTLLPTQNVAE
jgi:hypothetical protein